MIRESVVRDGRADGYEDDEDERKVGVCCVEAFAERGLKCRQA